LDFSGHTSHAAFKFIKPLAKSFLLFCCGLDTWLVGIVFKVRDEDVGCENLNLAFMEEI
jgi:hypothetical protein